MATDTSNYWLGLVWITFITQISAQCSNDITNPTIVMLHHPAQVRAYGPCTCKSRTTKIPPRSSRTTQESGSTSNHYRTCLPPTSPGQAAVLSSFSKMLGKVQQQATVATDTSAPPVSKTSRLLDSPLPNGLLGLSASPEQVIIVGANLATPPSTTSQPAIQKPNKDFNLQQHRLRQ